jgi:hypothetical protein
MEIKIKYNIKDTVYFIHNNQIICGQIYSLKIEAESVFGKQLHNSNAEKISYIISYKIVCEETRCNNAMENYFSESILFSTEEECIKNIKRCK